MIGIEKLNTENSLQKEAYEMLAGYLNIVAKSTETDYRFKIISKEEFEEEFRKKVQN